MHVRRPLSSTPSAVPFWGAAITWFPILAGMVLGTLGRAAVLVVGAPRGLALAVGLGCIGLGVALGAVWFRASVEADDWRGVAKLAGIWAVLTVGFRACWLGVMLGGGWAAVGRDYRLDGDQPGLPTLLLVLLVPLVLHVHRLRGQAG